MIRYVAVFVGLTLLLLSACGNDKKEVTPSGDPTQAARAFMNAFLNGDLTGCKSFASKAVQNSILEQCQAYADAQAITDLSGVSFILIEQDGLYALVEMQGTYTISAIDAGQRVMRQESTPIRIVMYYEDDFWRFDDFLSP
ncbi:MAG: hypothetical protein CUN55_02710 [Phototrophicales bacterium]|nr:MAG: hypothetical protein CUN55_02710 [Phototrophicales bacterium]